MPFTTRGFRRPLSLTLLMALAQQGLFAGTNFFVTLLLVRWLPLGDFGAYSFAFSIALLFQVLYESTLCEPIAILGAGKYADRIQT